VPAATPILDPLSKATGLAPDRIVTVNAGLQVAAGIALGVGLVPRPAAAVLAASLVPTTFAGHRFWEQEGHDARAQHLVQVLKNAAMLGGLLLAATSHGGRPSLPWRARRAARHLVGSAGQTIEQLRPAS
jgi:uncharacterized membrane protein YphA (DoxX/SURF4 family)